LNAADSIKGSGYSVPRVIFNVPNKMGLV